MVLREPIGWIVGSSLGLILRCDAVRRGILGIPDELNDKTEELAFVLELRLVRLVLGRRVTAAVVVVDDFGEVVAFVVLVVLVVFVARGFRELILVLEVVVDVDLRPRVDFVREVRVRAFWISSSVSSKIGSESPLSASNG
jgi:hypothetical protein